RAEVGRQNGALPTCLKAPSYPISSASKSLSMRKPDCSASTCRLTRKPLKCQSVADSFMLGCRLVGSNPQIDFCEPPAPMFLPVESSGLFCDLFSYGNCKENRSDHWRK